MTQKTTTNFLGDNEVVISGDVTEADRSVGWPGSAEVEQLFLLTPKGEQIDITELIHAVLAQGPEVWANLAQHLMERDKE